MRTNNIDKNIKEKLDNRTFQPSVSAWERLSVQLDEQPKQKKKGWFFYMSIAASILLLISAGFLFFEKEEVTIPSEIIVNTTIDTVIIDEKIDQFINEVPVDKVLVKTDKIDSEKKDKRDLILSSELKNSQKNKIKIVTPKETIAIVNANAKEENTEKESIKNKGIKTQKENLQQDPNSRIKINSDDLLYAVTHSPAEVKTYYAKYNVNREDVLRTIKSELKKSNIKVNPNTILAEVERTIDDDDFQNNFIKSLKLKVSDIATAIASRNN